MAKREIPEINAGSLADIAFLLLVFFLVTTTMDSDFGLMRKLPPIIEDMKTPPVRKRNLFTVLANKDDELLVKGKLMEVSELRNAAKEFIANPKNRADLPEKKEIDVPFFGRTMVSKQVISLQNDNATSYNLYIQVQNELAAAYNELRNELAMQQFGKTYDQLVEIGDRDRVKAIRKIYPQRISEAEPRNVGR
jgi:biopolymer transport protein ExbD